jgi:hypothetical protein
MLTVYTYRSPIPVGAIDLSGLPLEELADAALAIVHHQKTATVWFGYLDGWMLTPQEEVRLRVVLRTFPCHVVTHFPLALSCAWKNEIETIYTADPNGVSYPDHNGCSLRDGGSTRYDSAGT